MNELLLIELNNCLEKNDLKLNDASDDVLNSMTWKSKVNLKCLSCNQDFEISVKQLLRPHPERKGLICPKCETDRLFKSKMLSVYGRVPYEFISEFKGYTSELNVRCVDCGYEFKVNEARNLLSPKSLSFHPCKKCSNIRLFKDDTAKLEKQLTEKFGESNYEFLIPENISEGYSKKKIKIRCKECGNEFETSEANLLNGKTCCKVCNKKIKVTSESKNKKVSNINNTSATKADLNSTNSNAKSELKKWLSTIYDGELKFDSKDVVEDMPVDIYVPEKNIAVDLCLLKDNCHYNVEKKFHINRTLAYDAAGVRLIQIFEDEWENKSTIVKEKLKTILGKNNDSIYARKCKIVDISAQEKNEFLNNYHIQGEDRSTFLKALSYNGEIVAVMTLIRPRLALGSKKGTTIDEYELSRYASSKHVVGGFSKLFNALIKEHPEIKKIKTFADIRWSSISKNVYLTNGFIQKHLSSPNYWYFDTLSSAKDLKRIHRFNMRKQELPKKFPAQYDAKLTEFEIMDKTSYARIFDCGNLVYEYIL